MALHFGWFSWVFAIVLSLLFLFLILAEAYNVFIAKKDRKFWNGVSTLFTMIFMGYMARGGWDAVERYQMENHFDEPIIYGAISADGLYERFTQFDRSICNVDETEESRQCQFLMFFASSEEIHADYVSSRDRTLIRHGFWPFSFQQEFPTLDSVILDTE